MREPRAIGACSRELPQPKLRLTDRPADFAAPLWALGRHNWAAVPGGRLLVRPDGRPALLDTFSGELTELDPTWTSTGDLVADRSGRMALIVGSDVQPTQLVVIDPDGRRQVIRSAADELPPAFVPVPELRTFGGVNAVLYPPTNPDHVASAGTAPVIITVHGGTTAACR